MKLRDSGRRLGALLVALGVQAAIALLLLLSFTMIRLIAPPGETIIHLPPVARRPAIVRAPMVIDARPQTRPSSAATSLPPAADGSGIAVPPVQPPAKAELLQRLGPALNCAPDERGRPSPFCPPEIAIKPPDPNTLVLNPPSRVKDEERWAEEKRRNDSHDLGVAVGPGIGVVIQDPLCKLAWVMLGGGFKCGAPPRSTRPATEEQFQAALAAYHRRRGGGPKPALTSPPAEGTGNEKDRTAGTGVGADIGSGNVTAPGAGPGR